MCVLKFRQKRGKFCNSINFREKIPFLVMLLIFFYFFFLLTYSILSFARLLKISWGRSSTSLLDRSLKVSRLNALVFQKKKCQPKCKSHKKWNSMRKHSELFRCVSQALVACYFVVTLQLWWKCTKLLWIVFMLFTQVTPTGGREMV